MSATIASPAQIHVNNVVRCARAGCGRVLTNPKSIVAGVGPTCAKKLAVKAAETAARFSRDKVRRALGLISQGRVTPIRGTRTFAVVGATGGYVTSAVGCDCKAGRNHQDCYHLVAAKLLTA